MTAGPTDPREVPDPRDVDIAEYVLGTLDEPARTALRAEIARDPALRAAVADWERRLAPMVLALDPVTPPTRLKARIDASLAGDTSRSLCSCESYSVRSFCSIWTSSSLDRSLLSANLSS